MKHLILIISLLSSPAYANDCYLFAEVFAFDDRDTQQDYSGLSPLGTYGMKCAHSFDERTSIYTGLKHTSSIGYREIGKGFQGVFFGAQYKFTGL